MINIYNPSPVIIDNEFLFYDLFIRDQDIVGIGSLSSQTHNRIGIDYSNIKIKIKDTFVMGRWVKDDHGHTLIIIFPNIFEFDDPIIKSVSQLDGILDIGRPISVQINIDRVEEDELVLATIEKNEYKYILTWIDYHKHIGFNHFYIYDNASDDFEYLINILQSSKHSECITLIPWNYPYIHSESGISGQTSQQNHTIYKFHSCDMIGLIDIDEYFLFINDQSISSIRQDVDNRRKDISGISIQSIWYGCNKKIPYSHDNFLFKLVRRKENPEPYNSRQKCIVFPENVDVFSVHMVVKGKPIVYVPPHILRINHYFVLSGRKCTHTEMDEVFDNEITKKIAIVENET